MGCAIVKMGCPIIKLECLKIKRKEVIGFKDARHPFIEIEKRMRVFEVVTRRFYSVN